MSPEPTLVDELWESLVAVVVAATARYMVGAARPWLLGAALIATGAVAGGWLAGALIVCVIVLALTGLRVF
jgi:hypothetical protein